MTNQEIINGIKKDGKERDNALSYLFLNEKARNLILKIILQYGGTKDDFRDVFQDSLIILDNKIRNSSIDENIKVEAYFVSIAKFLWLSNRRKEEKTIALESKESFLTIESHYSNVEKQLEDNAKLELIKNALDQLNDDCKTLITNYYFGKSIKEIAYELKRNDASIRVLKSRCMRKLRNLLIHKIDELK